MATRARRRRLRRQRKRRVKLRETKRTVWVVIKTALKKNLSPSI